VISFYENSTCFFFPGFSAHWIKAHASSDQTDRCYYADKDKRKQDSIGYFFQQQRKIMPDHSRRHENDWNRHCCNQHSSCWKNQSRIVLPVSCQKQDEDDNQSGILGIGWSRVKYAFHGIIFLEAFLRVNKWGNTVMTQAVDFLSRFPEMRFKARG